MKTDKKKKLIWKKNESRDWICAKIGDWHFVIKNTDYRYLLYSDNRYVGVFRSRRNAKAVAQLIADQ